MIRTLLPSYRKDADEKSDGDEIEYDEFLISPSIDSIESIESSPSHRLDTKGFLQKSPEAISPYNLKRIYAKPLKVGKKMDRSIQQSIPYKKIVSLFEILKTTYFSKSKDEKANIPRIVYFIYAYCRQLIFENLNKTIDIDIIIDAYYFDIYMKCYIDYFIPFIYHSPDILEKSHFIAEPLYNSIVLEIYAELTNKKNVKSELDRLQIELNNIQEAIELIISRTDIGREIKKQEITRLQTIQDSVDEKIVQLKLKLNITKPPLGMIILIFNKLWFESTTLKTIKFFEDGYEYDKLKNDKIE